ncbi:MAG: nitrous oxide reductase [Crocinitomicaceae bacterium]|jgi:nitrous oxide reductase
MTIEKQDIIAKFVNTHIVKNKRDRSLHELNKKRASFVSKLNHQIPDLFKENRLIRINNPSLENIKSKLKATSKTACYIISHDELDDTIVEFDTAFNRLFGNGLGFCIVLTNGKGIYLEGEQIAGAPSRYFCL